MKFPYNIQMGFRPSGGNGGGASSHNSLSGIQGGTANDNYHFTQSQYIKLQNLIYEAPIVSANPFLLGNNLEVGDTLNVNTLINLSFTNSGNIYQNNVVIDGVNFALPKNNYLLNLIANHNVRGYKVLSNINIRRSDNQALINAYIQAFYEYKVFYFLHDSSDNLINNYSDTNLVSLIKTKQGILKSDKVLGTIRFNPSGLQNIYVAYPTQYGQVELATPTFPNNLVARSDRNFIYINNLINTNYRLTKMNDFIGGTYDAVIK